MSKVVKPTKRYRAHALLGALSTPFAARSCVNDLRQANVASNRVHEPLGYPSERRPSGRLIWFHIASSHNSFTILLLISAIAHARPKARFLITTDTSASTPGIAARLPARSQHQFAPLDAHRPLKRFIHHWRPDVAVLVQGGLRPNTLEALHKADVPSVMIAPQLSEKSLTLWRKHHKTAQFLLQNLSLVLTQTDATAQALIEIGSPPDRTTKGAHFKSLSAPSPIHGKTLEKMQESLKNRPMWAACATYEGEEIEILQTHAKLLKSHPDLCLLLAPQDPKRGDDIDALIQEHGLNQTRHSLDQPPEGQVFLADTIADWGIWYRLAAFAFIGGSIAPKGGHSPFGAAHAKTAVLSGIHIQNFAEAYAMLDGKGGARLVKGTDDLYEIAKYWLENPDVLSQAQNAVSSVIQEQSDQLDQIAMQVLNAVEKPPAKTDIPNVE